MITGKKILKLSVTTVTGLLVTTLVVGLLISSVGSWLSGGLEEWTAAMMKAAPFLLVWRILVYGTTALFWYSAYKKYQEKNDFESMTRLKKIGGLGVVLILFIEVPKILAKLMG